MDKESKRLVRRFRWLQFLGSVHQAMVGFYTGIADKHIMKIEGYIDEMRRINDKLAEIEEGQHDQNDAVRDI